VIWKVFSITRVRRKERVKTRNELFSSFMKTINSLRVLKYVEPAGSLIFDQFELPRTGDSLENQ
jgi:hypothetical protein